LLWTWEDHGPRPTWTKAQDPIKKQTKAKRAGGLPSRFKAMSSNPQYFQKEENKNYKS
jgi:hypothetical protein